MRFEALLLGFFCLSARAGDATKLSPQYPSWVGVYSSPSEIAGFTRTVLSIEKGFIHELAYRMVRYSDVVLKDPVDGPETRGDVFTEGDKLYIPVASGFYQDGRPKLSAHLERYTRLRINDRTVLLREDALKAYREKNELYDYGVLIKAAEGIDHFSDLSAMKHESIKVLYSDPRKVWKDPFVHGPNQR